MGIFTNRIGGSKPAIPAGGKSAEIMLAMRALKPASRPLFLAKLYRSSPAEAAADKANWEKIVRIILPAAAPEEKEKMLGMIAREIGSQNLDILVDLLAGKETKSAP